MGYRPGQFPAAEAAYAGAISLPIWPGMTDAQVDRVADGLRSAATRLTHAEPMSDRILVVGAGYVGIVTALGLVELGHRVELVETRADRRLMLGRGESPIFEAGVPEVLGPATRDGSIVVREAAAQARYDLVHVCVGTPIADDGSSDLSQLRSAFGGDPARRRRGHGDSRAEVRWQPTGRGRAG